MPSFNNQSKNSSSLSDQSKNLSGLDRGLYFLLQEIGDYLLQENGCKIALEESTNYKNRSSLSNLNKI